MCAGVSSSTSNTWIRYKREPETASSNNSAVPAGDVENDLSQGWRDFVGFKISSGSKFSRLFLDLLINAARLSTYWLHCLYYIFYVYVYLLHLLCIHYYYIYTRMRFLYYLYYNNTFLHLYMYIIFKCSVWILYIINTRTTDIRNTHIFNKTDTHRIHTRRKYNKLF